MARRGLRPFPLRAQLAQWEAGPHLRDLRDRDNVNTMEMEIVLPEEVPVMTLPETSFFPQALLPLHIFEPRYRHMLKDVLAADRLFAVAGLDPADSPEPPHRVATVGIVRACQKNENGTSNLLIQGLSRVRIMGIAQEEPYRRIRIEALTSHAGAEDDANVALKRTVRRLIRAKAQLGGNVPDDFLKFLGTVNDPEVFVDLVSFNLCHHVATKQRLLETLSVHERLNLLGNHLRHEVEVLHLQKKLQGELPDDAIDQN